MAVTFNTFAGNGTTGPFSFTFEYIDETDVKVSIDGVTQATTAYTFPTASTIQFVSLTPTSSQTIRIFRETDVDDLKATFFAGSSIRSQDLNDNFEQNNFAVQEIKDQYVTKENGEFSTNVDMNSNRITELADPVNAQDAVTKQYLEDNYFDDGTETIVSGEAWPGNDTTIATTQSIDNRIDSKVDTAIEGDVLIDNTGLSKSATGGQVTLGIAANSVDLDRIKDSDKVVLSEQEADSDLVGTDDQVFTAKALTRRFNNYYQNEAPTTTAGVGIGQVWVDPNDDLTLSVWNGSSWTAITSGGTFTNQPKVVYVDAESGDDSNDGHRISRPKKTIAAALSDINGDASGDGSIISVAPGIYAETLPLNIQKNDIGIIGQSLRTCIIHPKIPTADHAGYDVNTPHSQELETMFRVNSGSSFANLTLTGLKASGSRGTGASLYTNTTYGLPPNQGWNFAFYPGATIKKSPYIQNVTNFSDSQINNVTFTPHTPGEGAAGDLDSAPTGGGILVDGSVPATASPLRSMVCDSYTHTALDGPGIFVTNNGYCQATSSYAFFNHGHITCLNGGQANLAASTTDFGRYGLIADGKSTSAIFTSNVDGAASSGAISFNVNQPTAGSGWFGDTQRPATNMLVEVNSVIYPILSATANTDSEGGSGWTVTISRPDPNNRSTNLGLNGAISDDAAVSFYLRSMIASSSHTMEYVGSGTDYRALPENGGVPVEANQKIELNNGKIWTATTDHNGKFTIGGNQTDDPFFEVDQQLGFVTIPEGSIAFNLVSDLTPQLGGNLDVNGNTITSTSNANVVLDPNGTGTVDVSTSRITSVTDPTGAQDAATKNYVDTNFVADAGGTMSGDLAMGTNKITGLGDPTAAQDAATKTYVDTANTTQDTAIAAKLPLAGGTMTGAIAMGTSKITGLGDPTAAQDAATKNYVDTNFVDQTASDGSANLPVGTTAQRDASPAAGMIRYNSTLGQFEGYTTTWGAIGGGATGGGSDTWAVEHDNTITQSYTIGTGKNVISAGPLTVNSGATVTVPSGSTWTIV